MPLSDFWQVLEELVLRSEIVIDRPKNTAHPRYPDMIYPVDYGYLTDTRSMDGEGIDLYRGSDPAGRLDAILCVADLHNRDSEIKLLIGCTAAEKQIIERFQNQTDCMKALLIPRAT